MEPHVAHLLGFTSLGLGFPKKFKPNPKNKL
jgi:hypothetical protein